MYSVGLDYHQNRSSLHILDAQGARFKALEVKGDWRKLLQVVETQVPRPFNLCFEASCGYGHLYDQLAQQAASVQVAHPGELHTIFRSKKKHDRIDAAKIAKILYLDLVPKVHVPQTDIRQWRALIEFRRQLLGKRTALKVQLRALCRSLGLVDLPKGKKLFARQGLAQLQALALPEVSALQRDLLLEQLASLQDQQQRVEQELARIAQPHPQVQLLLTIPGVGLRTAEAYLAYVDDIRRFRRVNQVGAYFGMVPCEDSSADTRRLGHITKDGPAAVRWLICEAAWQGVRRSPTIRAYHARIIKRIPTAARSPWWPPATTSCGSWRRCCAAEKCGTRASAKRIYAPSSQTEKQSGPTPKSRPRRLLHAGARVASSRALSSAWRNPRYHPLPPAQRPGERRIEHEQGEPRPGCL